MKIYNRLLVLLMLSPFAFSEMKPSMAQTSSFLAQELENNYTDAGFDLCDLDRDSISDITMDVDVGFGFLSINRSCLSRDPGRTYFSARIPLSKVTNIVLGQFDSGEAEVFSLKFGVDRNCRSVGGSCMTSIISYMVHVDFESNEPIEPYQSTNEDYSDRIILILQNYSEENLKASKRIFNALKRYAELNDWEIEFKDETYQQVNGSVFD
jgi:hypothetical protein